MDKNYFSLGLSLLWLKIRNLRKTIAERAIWTIKGVNRLPFQAWTENFPAKKLSNSLSFGDHGTPL